MILDRLRGPWRGILLAGLLLAGSGLLVAWRMLAPGLAFLDALRRPEPAGAAFTLEVCRAGAQGVPVKVYRPAGPIRQALLVVHGVHAEGFDEPRLVRFCRELARRGTLVVAPDLAELRAFNLSPSVVDAIEASALFLLDDPRVMGARLPRRPGLFGISFAGGLGLSAAGRPSLRHRLGFVGSFGGHGDLDRVMRYLADGRLGNGRILPPHPYGQAVLARTLADRLVPGEQVEPLRRTLLRFLQANPDALRASLPDLGPEARRIADLCISGDSRTLGALMGPLLVPADPRLSPARGPVPECPVLLLHASADNIIPADETVALAAWASPHTPTRFLLSDLLRHAELENGHRPPLLETVRLLRFLTVLLES